MNFSFQSQSEEEISRTGDSKKGLLRVAVPHWATELKIYNNALERVTGLGKIVSESAEKADAAGVYQSEISLKPGMYQVEASLEGKTESIWIPVQSGHMTEVFQNNWKGLEFTSSAPLNETAGSEDIHIKAAEDWSRKSTCQKTPNCDSSLFLFIHTAKPERYGQTFADGLQLFDETGELVTDFSSGVEKDEKEGWMAFHAEMKSGGYILRRGRPGVRLRYQVIHLCEKWQTQVFIQSERFPSVRTLGYNMTSLEKGQKPAFRAEDKTALAAEAILNFLRYESDSHLLFNNERLEILLEEKTKNPWLGILAAYAITKLKEDVSSRERRNFQQYFTVLKDKILPFLEREIPSHPDVRALLLKDKREVSQPFSFPPMLWQSLKKVYAHSDNFPSTVPAGSLTDCIRANVIANSPWVAWRSLGQKPTFNWTGKSDLFAVDKAIEEPAAVMFPSSIPKAPIYRWAAFDPTDIDKPAGEGISERSGALLEEISIIQKAKEVVKDFVLIGKSKKLPETVQVDPSAEINKLLEGVDPTQVSQFTGMSLPQAHSGIEQLKSMARADPAGSGETMDLVARNTVARVACAQSDMAAMSDLAQSVKAPPVSLKEMVGQLWTESQRIDLKVDKIAGVPKKYIKEIVNKINLVALKLLERADFVVISDLEGRIEYCNGVFLQLVGSLDPSGRTLSPGKADVKRRSIEKFWKEVLIKVKPGSAVIPDKKFLPGFGNWEVQRVQIEADQGSKTGVRNLDVLRVKGRKPLTDTQLWDFNIAISDLSNFTSLLSYGSEENSREYLTELEKILTKIEKTIVKIGTGK